MKTAAFLWGLLGGIGIGYLAGRYAMPGDAGVSSLELKPSPSTATTSTTGVDAPPSSSPRATSAASSSEQAGRMSLRDRLHELAKLSSSHRRGHEMEQYLAGLTAAEMPVVLMALRELPTGHPRLQLVSQLFERWGALDGPGALAAASRLPTRERWSNESQALQGWARSDPYGAWETAKEIAGDSAMGGFRMAGAIRELARVDLNKAIDESINATDMGKPMFRGLILETAAETGKLEVVMQSALQITSAEDREAWIKDIFRRWGSVDTDAPMSALRSIPDAALARSAMSGLMSGWSDLDPKGALDFALENHGDPVVADALGSMLGSTAHMLRESEIRELLDTAKAKGAYDAVAPQLLNPMAMHRPALAVELAATISDEKQRNQVITHAMSMWANNDFAAATAHFETMPASSTKLEVFHGLAWRALHKSDGPTSITRWMNTFSGANRVQAAEQLVRAVENQQRNAKKPLPPEGATLLAQAISETPDLPAEVLEKARKLLLPSPAQ